jgi:hypothetical protein
MQSLIPHDVFNLPMVCENDLDSVPLAILPSEFVRSIPQFCDRQQSLAIFLRDLYQPGSPLVCETLPSLSSLIAGQKVESEKILPSSLFLVPTPKNLSPNSATNLCSRITFTKTSSLIPQIQPKSQELNQLSQPNQESNNSTLEPNQLNLSVERLSSPAINSPPSDELKCDSKQFPSTKSCQSPPIKRIQSPPIKISQSPFTKSSQSRQFENPPKVRESPPKVPKVSPPNVSQFRSLTQTLQSQTNCTPMIKSGSPPQDNPPPSSNKQSDFTLTSHPTFQAFCEKVLPKSDELHKNSINEALQSLQTNFSIEEYKQPTPGVKRKKWADEDMLCAIELASTTNISARIAADLCNVPRSTLWDRLSGRVIHGIDKRKIRRIEKERKSNEVSLSSSSLSLKSQKKKTTKLE